jgi:hypothetical protein
MTYVDLAVLNLTERVCREFQRWTGRSNVWLAFQLTNLSIVLYFVWVAVLYLLSGDLAFRTFVALFCGGVFFALTRTLFRVSVEASEIEAYRRVANGLRNPRRVRDAQLRIAFLTLSVVLSYPLWLAYVTLRLHFVLLTDVLIILTTVVLYVLACDPLPPCPGRVRAWLRGMAPARQANAPTRRHSEPRVRESVSAREASPERRGPRRRPARRSRGMRTPHTARFLLQTSHVRGPACSLPIGRPATLSASLIWP